MIKILKEEVILKDSLIIKKATIYDGKEEFSRLKVAREDAACVFIYNEEKDAVVLIKQFRYPIADKVRGPVYEIVAGKLDEGEEPVGAALREAEEECGYRVQPANIKLLASFFVSPGYTSERFFLYYATVKSRDKAGKGGGLENEHEHIDIIEMPSKDFLALAEENRLEDGKTLMAALYFKMKRFKDF